MDLSTAMERLIRIRPVEAMREDERASGFEPVLPGAVSWLSADDWPDDIVVSTKGRKVRIVAIKAKQIGKGAFSRLIGAIACAGLNPIVVEPLFDMPAILHRWNWKPRITGSGFEREESWRPNQRWLRERAARTSAKGEGEG